VNQRLQTKCFVASAAMHTLLLVIVFVAPAFLPEQPRPQTPVIQMIDPRVLDRLEARAAAPAAPAPVQPAPAAPDTVEPAPAPKAVEVPRPVEPTPPPPATKPVAPPKKEVAKEPPPKITKVEPRPLPASPKGKEAPVKKDTKKAKEPDSPPTKSTSTKPAPTKEAPKSTIKLADTKHLVSRRQEEDAKAKQRAEAEERAQAAAAAKAALAAHQQRVARMNSILGGISGGLSSPVDINIDAGAGPNAAAFLEYGQMMVQVYERSWLLPGTLNDTTAVVGVTVTVARSGRVLNWEVRRPSGNSAIDKSVRETLQKVIQFEPFPASFREAQRTFNIDFNLKAKRSTG
jgi:TonB family protein